MNRLTYCDGESFSGNKSYECAPLVNVSVKDCLNKLGKLEDIETELGCPLDVVFKAIRSGILFMSADKYFNDKLAKNFTSRPRLYYSDDLKCYCFEIGLGVYYVKIKDYKKTWWLKEDLSE